MSEQSAWDDLSWPASTMTFATFYQDVKLVQKQLEEATRTRTGNHAFEIDTANKFETIKRAITRGTKGYKGLYTILKETADNMSGSIITDDEFNEFVQKVNDQEKTLREHGDLMPLQLNATAIRHLLSACGLFCTCSGASRCVCSVSDAPRFRPVGS